MKEKVSVVLIGINGYGTVYLEKLLHKNDNAYIAGIVEIHPEKSKFYHLLIERNIPIFKSVEDFYTELTADLAVISTPIQLHKPQAITAMQHGSNVLCEKPAAGHPEDIQEMIKVRDQTKKFLAVGFNWSFTSAVQELKRDILKGMFGNPIRFKSIVLWPRNVDYYNRSSWAGRKYSANHEPIFDSVANNATAHFLHHLFFLLGAEMDTSAKLKDVKAELYRVNCIETFDTCAVRAHTTEQVEVLYYASHSTRKETAPRFNRFELEFENAVLYFHPGNSKKGTITTKFHNGSITHYPELDHDSLAKLDVCIEAAKNDNHKILCGIEAASTQVDMIHAMHQSVPDIPSFPDDIIHYEKNEKLYWVEDLDGILINCYEEGILPGDKGVSWSRPGKEIKL